MAQPDNTGPDDTFDRLRRTPLDEVAYQWNKRLLGVVHRNGRLDGTDFADFLRGHGWSESEYYAALAERG